MTELELYAASNKKIGQYRLRSGPIELDATLDRNSCIIGGVLLRQNVRVSFRRDGTYIGNIHTNNRREEGYLFHVADLDVPEIERPELAELLRCGANHALRAYRDSNPLDSRLYFLRSVLTDASTALQGSLRRSNRCTPIQVTLTEDLERIA